MNVGLQALAVALGGGLAIGAAVVLLFAVHGRVFGVSGLANGILDGLSVRKRDDLDWRVATLIGLVLGALIWTLVVQGSPAPRSGFPGWALVIGGLLVGAGTRLGSGCTSGHGVCGVARLSPRSIAATATFMATGIITVYLLRHALGVLP